MCGICGIISTDRINNAEYRLEKMLQSIKHRGPDAQGKTVFEGQIALGQRRLSIIDLNERANQPMHSVKGDVIVYNGEVYNFMEIRKKISYPFATLSDTEVLLAGIEEKGIEWLLQQCNGMFGFAYHNRLSGETYLARDRMGIKPLYYYQKKDLIVFGSEIKSILNSGLVEAVFNEDAIDEYLANRYIRAPYTFFKNIYQVMPGHYLRVTPQCDIQDIPYWHLPDEFNMGQSFDEHQIEEEFEGEVINAIKRRMVSDVPLGAYLSGGVDSSLIAAVASKEYTGKLNTYTIGFSEMNEFSYADMVARRYGTDHHEILMDGSDYFDKMDEIIGYKDAPLGVPNEIPLAVMSRELKKRITVVLSGEGADELMGGYGRIFRSAFDYQNPGICKGTTFYEYFIKLYEYVPREMRDSFLTVGHGLRTFFDCEAQNDFVGKPNEENVFRFFHKYHVKGLLQRVDTTTMLASVEARVPFLDHTLIEYVYKNVPYDLKLFWKSNEYLQHVKGMVAADYSELADIPKYLLRKVAAKYLPDEVIHRRKMGFPVPLNDWMATLMMDARKRLKNAYWLRTDNLEKLLEECGKEQRAGQIIWMFINIEMFREKYFEREWRY